MATGKRYNWIKLKASFFDDDGPVDYLMSQPNGAQYVVLYQMLCLKTINTNGKLSTKLGEVIVPYDAEKIRRSYKYFDRETIMVALNVFAKLGLIYEDRNRILTIAENENIVRYETDYTAQQSRQRALSGLA